MVRTGGKDVRRRKTAFDFIMDTFVYGALVLLAITTVVPFMRVIAISLSPAEIVGKYGLHLIPEKVTFDGYIKVFYHSLIWKSYSNTIARTILGTGISVFLYIIGAYPLSKKYLPNKKFWTMIIIFTMYFSGGLIPSYILVTKTLHLQNTIWSLVLPSAVSAYTLIIIRNFFMTIPDEIEESAKIDGANDIYILFSIIIPLSKAVLATITLWCLVYHWNSWFDCMIYITDQNKYVLQLVLRMILIEGQVQDLTTTTTTFVNTDTMKMATLVVATLPIICAYPFMQKYFVKGVIIGSVKG
jgi:putative aldouronate transport system permease protein